MKTLKQIVDEIDIWEGWQNNYKDYVPLFIEEALTGKDWSEWDNEVFIEFFDKSSDQCVSSLKLGYFTVDEKDRIKANWQEIAPILKNIAASQNKALFESYHELKKIIRKYTNQNRKAATNRLIAGLQPKLLCTIVNEERIITFIKLLNKNVENCNIEITWDWFKNSNAVWQYYLDNLDSNSVYDNITLPWQTYELLGNDVNETNEMSEIIETKSDNIELLKYKKQIILQGPPGTGKTRLAKEIAKTIILKEIGSQDIIKYLTIGEYISNSSGKDNFYNVKEINIEKNEIILTSANSKDGNYAKFHKIVERINELNNDIIPDNKNGQDPYEIAIAKHILSKLDNIKELKDNEQYKLIQFHPSYTYEDFVRGIVAKPNDDGDGIIYEAENKTLGKFAKEALRNYNASNNDSTDSNIDVWIDEHFEDFKNEIETSLTDTEYNLSGEITIYKIRNKDFLYGKNWLTKGHIKFDEFKKLIKAIIKGEIILGSTLLDRDKFVHSHYRYTYYNALLKNFFDKYKYTFNFGKSLPKTYILIIDEINRANLSSVLGEMIYSLEYRGEEVESMYEVDGSQKLILPPNLYIIGTMNTADRSVGNIDYAIRRRFAFVDVLPTDEAIDDVVLDIELNLKAKNLYKKVKDMFNEDKSKTIYLQSDFKAKDVQLGHSYFLAETEKQLQLKLEFEIKPLLKEYVKDGILSEDAIIEIELL